MYARDVESALKVAAKNRYWREVDATMVLSLWRDSGQTLSAFCDQWGINVVRLRRWQKRLADVELPTFHPAVLVGRDEPPAVEAGGVLEVTVAGGRRIVVRPGFDEVTLMRVVKALETDDC